MKRGARLQGICISQKPHFSVSPVKELSLKVPLMESLAERYPISFFHLSKSPVYESPPSHIPGSPRLENRVCINLQTQRRKGDHVISRVLIERSTHIGSRHRFLQTAPQNKILFPLAFPPEGGKRPSFNNFLGVNNRRKWNRPKHQSDLLLNWRFPPSFTEQRYVDLGDCIATSSKVDMEGVRCITQKSKVDMKGRTLQSKKRSIWKDVRYREKTVNM